MAVWEKRTNWVISQVSWTDWTAQDVYYGLEHSFQYSANINTDDEMHGIKLANEPAHTSNYSKCQLVSLWENGVMALPATLSSTPQRFEYVWAYYDSNNNYHSGSWSSKNSDAWPSTWVSGTKTCPWVVFQDYFWYWGSSGSTWNSLIAKVDPKSTVSWWNPIIYRPQDHPDSTDESISTPTTWDMLPFKWAVSAILNYNNTRLVVACWQDIWVYYPELDQWLESWDVYYWRTWWKKVLSYEEWVYIVALTCTFEYLKVWAVDEWWNTKVYYYQWNNNLRDTFVYNVIDLTWEKVLRVYSINSIDYFITSIDWTDGYVNLNKMVWNVPVQLFHQRAWLDPLDVNYKAPYFVWPVGINAAYKSGRFYVADSYGVFQFKYTPQSFDKWYMKWMLSSSTREVYGVCENKGFLYVSDEDWCWAMRLYDTWVDGYQSNWVLISREYEWKEWGTLTKMLDEVRLNFELNPNTNNVWTINIYVSPNNLWKSTSSFTEANGWYHAMSITSDSKWTRTEKSNLLNNMWNSSKSSFANMWDWQTITYAIVMWQSSPTHATPIVRQIDLRYHVKDKTNNVYDIN
jgi:hypothetical protein